MTGYVVTPDWGALPVALLPLAKQHLRVTFPDDDEVIKSYLQFAIAYFENQNGWLIFAATVAWSPDLATNASRHKCPVQPVSAFTVMSGSTDVSADYALQSASPVEPVWLVKKDGTAFAADAAIDLVAGYAAVETIPPSVLADVLRIAATLYEHRESVSTLSVEQMPFWLNDLLTGHWIPRA